MRKFVKITRVSTKEQGKSGLGLEGQSNHIDEYVASVGGEIIAEYQEILTGDFKEDIGENVSLDILLKPRQQLLAAIELAKKEGATLIVHEQSRLTRSPLVFEFIIHNKVDIVSSSAPNDTIFIMRIKCALAADEVLKVKTRTINSLSVIKKNIAEKGFHISKKGNRITTLGNPVNIVAYNSRPRENKANPNMLKVKSYVESLRKNGMTLDLISAKLNSDGYRTPNNCMFTKGQVSRLLSMA